MAYTPLYNKALVESSKHGLSLAKKHSKAEMLEIFEAWVSVGLLGLIENIGHAAALQMVKDKMGDPSPPRSKPQLVVDNTKAHIVEFGQCPIIQPPCDCA